MTEDQRNCALALLRRLDEKVDRVLGDLQDIKHRVSSLERQVADIRVDMAAMAMRMDRIDGRLDRMERRLDLVPAASK